MPEPIARAAADVAHSHGQLVYSHPSNLEGTRIAVRSGVDVLAHPPDTTEGVDEAVLQEMVDRRMAMIPTLKMFADTASPSLDYLNPIYEVVHRFHVLGGELLFGTDVGYMADYSTEDEFRALARSGLDARDVLRMLTTAPAERFGVGKESGSVAVGGRAPAFHESIIAKANDRHSRRRPSRSAFFSRLSRLTIASRPPIDASVPALERT